MPKFNDQLMMKSFQDILVVLCSLSMTCMYFQTLFRLEEIKHMMKSVQDGLAADVHLGSPEAQAVVEALGTEHIEEGRPSSVVSYMLNDPYLYRPRPQAQMMQTILE